MTSASVTDIPAFMGNVQANAPVADSSRNSSDFMQMMNDKVSKDSDGISILSDHLSRTGNKDATTDETGVPMPANNSYRKPAQLDTDSSQKKINISPEKADKAKNALETFSKGVNDAIKDEMDVTDEEITEAMETLGLTYADLMIPENLQKLVASLSTEEQAAELLVSDTLPNLFSTISELATNLISDSGLKPEDIKGLEVEFLLNGDIDEAGLKLNDAFAPVRPESNVVMMPEAQPADTSDEVSIEGLLGATGDDAFRQANPIGEGTPANADKAIGRVDRDIEAAEGELVHSDKAVSDEADDIEDEAYDEVETVITENVNKTAETMNSGISSGSGSDSGYSFGGSRQTFASDNTAAQAENASVQSFVQEVQTDAAEQAVEVVTRYTDVDTESVMQQIVSRASTTITETVSRMEMELNPQNLGRMILQVSQQEGAITARLIAQSDAVREALESQLALLRDNLNNAGVKVEAVEISVGTHEFERALEEGMSNTAGENDGNASGSGEASESAESAPSRGVGSINLNDPDAEDLVLNEDEILAANMMRDQGNSMNVRA